MKMPRNKFVLACHLDDLNFLLENYSKISIDCIKEFDLPQDTIVKLRPRLSETPGRLRTFFNGEEYGDIVIKDKGEGKPKKKEVDRGLH